MTEQEATGAAALVDQAMALFSTDMLQAETLVRQAIKAAPRLWRAHFVLAFLMSRRQRHAESLASLERAVALNPGSADCHFNIGYMAQQLGDLPRAETAFQQAATLTGGNNVPAQILHGACRHQQGDALGAAALLGALTAQYPNNDAARHAYARALADAGETESAAAEFASLRRAVPDDDQRATDLVSFTARYDYPGWQPLDDKSGLGELVRRYQTAGRKPAFPFYPETYRLPEETEAWQAAHRESPRLWILKGDGLSGGQSAFVVEEPSQAPEAGAWVAQRYVADPLLLDGRKFNMRLYVLVDRIDPLHACMWANGVATIAAEPYRTDSEGLALRAAHIINPLALDSHPDMHVAGTIEEDGTGNVWTLPTLFDRLAHQGVDVALCWRRLVEVSEGLVNLAGFAGMITDQLKGGLRHAYPSKLLGMDVMLDQSLHPHLLEVERFPGLSAPAHDAISNITKTRLRRDVARLILSQDGREASSSTPPAGPTPEAAGIDGTFFFELPNYRTNHRTT